MSNKKVFIEIRVSDKATKPLKDTEKGTKGLFDANELLKKSYDDLTVAERNYLVELSKQKIQTQETKAAVDALAASQLRQAKSSKTARTNAGLNNAIIAESARLASDASYGYTAIANNLGQLISLFSASANAAGGLSSAFTALLSIQSLFLIAIQLLITYGDDIYNFFVGGASAIDEETEALKKNNAELEKNIELRQLYNRSRLTITRNLAKDIRDVFFSNIDAIEIQEDKLNALGKLLEERGVKNAKLVSDETIALDARLLIAEKLIEAEQIRADQSLEYGKIKEAELSLAAKQKELDEAINNQTGDFAKEGNKLIRKLKKDVKFEEGLVKSRLTNLTVYERRLTAINSKIEELKKRGIVLTPDDEKEEKRQRRFLRKFLDFTSKIEAARLVARTASLSREEDLIKERGKGEIKLLQERTNRFIEIQKQRLKDNLITDKQYRDSEIQAYAEFEEAKVAISAKTDALLVKLGLKRAKERNEIDLQTFRIREANELELSLISERIEGKRARARIDLQASVVQQEINSIERRLAAGQLEVDERAKLENELSKKQGEQAKIRMAIADAEANAKIQAFQVTADALNAFAKLAGEDTKAGKALAVSGALISTYLSAQKAFESQFKPLATIDSPVRGAIAAAAAVATGLANVKAILSVDPNGETQTKSAVSAPAFNVVGTSVSNQLLDTIAGQLGNPSGLLGDGLVRAYVVGSDVTNQQNLDRQIEGGASLFD